MLVSLPFRRFIERLAGFWPRRRCSRRLRLRRRDLSFRGPAIVETLEGRVLLSAIVVNSTDGGQHYASTVTFGQLDPAHTAVTLRDAVNAANNTTGADTISFDSSVFPQNAANPTTIVLSGGTPLELKDTTGATTISGPGAGVVAVSGNNLSTIFQVDAGVTGTIGGLTLTGGKASVNFAGALAGGAIYNAGALTLQNDVITANSAATYGGGFFNSGNVTLTGSTLSGDSAQFGGGFFNSGNVTVTGSILSADSASVNGGGFYSLGTVSLASSTLTGDSATSNGGGFFSNNVVTLTGSTLDHNSSQFGGGFYNARNVTVTESTLTANTGQSGGAIFNASGNITLTSSTVAANFGTFNGGGIYNSFGNVTLTDTILARNTVSPANSTPSDWVGTFANAASSYSLLGDGTGTGLTNGVSHNIVGNTLSPVDPHLAALANNGGPTQTMALLAGSPAINAGSNALVAALPNDQRGAGFSRIAGGTVDIGAFEIQSHPPAAPSTKCAPDEHEHTRLDWKLGRTKRDRAAGDGQRLHLFTGDQSATDERCVGSLEAHHVHEDSRWHL